MDSSVGSNRPLIPCLKLILSPRPATSKVLSIRVAALLLKDILLKYLRDGDSTKWYERWPKKSVSIIPVRTSRALFC